MAKKEKEKEEEKKVIKKPSPPDKPAEDQPEPENPFDFGGLPKRDLKKNLGCG